MYNLGRAISRGIGLISNLGAVFIIVMMLHITADVVMRFFDSSVDGTIEIVTNYYMIIIGF